MSISADGNSTDDVEMDMIELYWRDQKCSAPKANLISNSVPAVLGFCPGILWWSVSVRFQSRALFYTVRQTDLYCRRPVRNLNNHVQWPVFLIHLFSWKEFFICVLNCFADVSVCTKVRFSKRSKLWHIFRCPFWVFTSYFTYGWHVWVAICPTKSCNV